MPKTNCNIIKDLLPSYIDELCSIESKQLVEEHFVECNTCKKLYEQMTQEDLYHKHEKTNTNKEIDYLKKFRLNVNKKNTILLIAAAILLFLQININYNAYLYFVNGTLVNLANYIFPILIAGTLFAVLPDFTEHAVPNKIKLPILGIQFAGMTYIFILMTFVGHSLLKGKLPFGLQPAEIGPFLIVQIFVLAFCFFVAFLATLIMSLTKRAICPALCFLPLGGLSLMLQYRHLLHEYTTPFELSLFIQPYLIIVCEISLLVGLYMFLNRTKSI